MFKSGVLAGLLVIGLFGIVSCREASPPPVVHRDERAAAGPRSATDGQPREGEEDYGRRGRRRSRHGAADRTAAPGSFDFYLLNLSWSPEFCATHGNSLECGRGLGFVVHGLWPQDVSGDYPEDCSDAAGAADPQKYTDLIPTASLVAHEWQTHGTCSGLDADAYFGLVRKAFGEVKIPAGIGTSGDAGGFAPEQLLTRFAAANPGFPEGSFALSCGNNRLTALEVCLNKDLRPESCQGVRSCRAQVIRVTPR